ncbi:MAG TPA: hypothetical protein VF170_19785 [Planctomycetaceae bacterium]
MASAYPPTNPTGAGVSRAVDPNTPARIALRLGLLSLPLGPLLLFGIPAIVAGVMGLRRQAAAPSAAGTRNAWIGILLGLITAVVWGWVIYTLAIGGGGSQD